MTERQSLLWIAEIVGVGGESPTVVDVEGRGVLAILADGAAGQEPAAEAAEAGGGVEQAAPEAGPVTVILLTAGQAGLIGARWPVGDGAVWHAAPLGGSLPGR
jgi:hypothetical protein